MTNFDKNIQEAIKKYKSKTPEQKAKEKKDLKKRKDAMNKMFPYNPNSMWLGKRFK